MTMTLIAVVVSLFSSTVRVLIGIKFTSSLLPLGRLGKWTPENAYYGIQHVLVSLARCSHLLNLPCQAESVRVQYQ